MSDTIAAISTGAQVSAIGIARLSGPDTMQIIDKVFFPSNGKAMSSSPCRKLMFGELRDRNGEILDICMCTISRGPNSYTGEDTAELQCHGSPTVLRTALEELFYFGARQAGPGEFTKRAFLNGRMDLTASEAVIDLIDAETAEAARNAAGQLSGVMGVKIDAVYSRLADISSHYHAVLDYPDEDIEDFTLASYEETLEAAEAQLKALLSTFNRGKNLNSGIPTAIAGSPNVGKSSLLNALLGYDRAIVTDIPGTTRDTIEEKVKLGRVTLRLIDTAGIHETKDTVEKLGVERSLDAVKKAELLIAVVDGSRELKAEDMEIIRYAEKAENAILVISKSDLSQTAVLPETGLKTIQVSSLTGEGLDRLETAVNELFPVTNIPAGEILTNARQADAVKRALESMNAALEAMRSGSTPDIVLTETEGAMNALGELTGRIVREDITNRIFSRFCVGK